MTLARGTRLFALGDVPVLVRLGDERRAEAFRSVVGRDDPVDTPPRATLVFLAEGPGVPSRPPDRVVDDVDAWHDAGALVLRHRSGMTARVEGTVATVGGGDADLVRAFRRLFQLVVTQLLAPLDRFVLHGGGLLAGDGRARLAVGDAGTGKSTLALAALSAGWRVLSDDLVVLRWRDGDGLEAAGIPRPIAVPGELGGAALEGARPLAGDPRERWELPVDVLEPGWWPVAGTVALAHAAGADGDLRRLTGREALPRLVGSFLSAGDPDLLRRWFPAAAALGRLPAWELGHGADPSSRLAAARRGLAAVAAQ